MVGCLSNLPLANFISVGFFFFFLPVSRPSNSVLQMHHMWVYKFQKTKSARLLLWLALSAQHVARQYLCTNICYITLSAWHFCGPNKQLSPSGEERWCVRIKHRVAAFSPTLFFVWPKISTSGNNERHHGAPQSFHSLYKVRMLDLTWCAVCMCVHERGTKTQGPSSPCPAGAQRDWMTINWTRYRMCRIWPQRKDWNRHCRPVSPGQLEGRRGRKEGRSACEWANRGDSRNNEKWK